MTLRKAVKRSIVLSLALGAACLGNISSTDAGGGPGAVFKVESEESMCGDTGYRVVGHKEGRTYVNVGIEACANDELEISFVDVKADTVYLEVKRIHRPTENYLITYQKSKVISFEDKAHAVTAVKVTTHEG